MNNYLKSCQSEFWQKVFEKEVNYLVKELKDCKNILSVGCGPAFVERGLMEMGFNVTGLDVSRIALEGAPDGIRAKVGSAEEMPFNNSSFDAIIYIASLQFISNYEKAIKETARVLKPEGRILVMLLNPKSEFVKNKLKNEPDSYMQKMRYGTAKDATKIKAIIKQYFDKIKTTYYLGIKGKEVFKSQEPNSSALYIIRGAKK